MKPPITISDLKKTSCWKLNGHLEEGPKKNKSKYGNTRVLFEDTWFDSKKELARFLQLRMLEKVGEITGLIYHPDPYELNPGGTYSLKYEPDFTYYRKGEFIVEDCKGYRTKIYLKKRGLMEKVHNIKIYET